VMALQGLRSDSTERLLQNTIPHIVIDQRGFLRDLAPVGSSTGSFVSFPTALDFWVERLNVCLIQQEVRQWNPHRQQCHPP